MKKRWYILLGSIQLFVGIGAVASGLGFILAPDGSNLGLTTEALSQSPFKSYLVPGILLLLVNGIGNLTAVVLSYRQHRLAGHAGIIFGGALIVWIIVQVIMIGFASWLQPAFLIIGIIMFFFGLMIWRRGDGS
jgi:hypothetical protein